MPSITSANVANAIVKLVAADALPALMGNLVMGNLVNRRITRWAAYVVAGVIIGLNAFLLYQTFIPTA